MAKRANPDLILRVRVLLSRSSVIAVTLAAVALALPQASAAPVNQTTQSECESSGKLWSREGRGCANKKCRAYGKTYEPGHTQVIHSGPNKGRYYMCDGFTGGWTMGGIMQPGAGAPTLKQNPNPVGSAKTP